MPLVRNDDLVRLDLPAEGEWVDLKRRISKGERQRLAAAAARNGHLALRPGEGVIGDVEVPVDEEFFDAVAFTALDIGIRAWSFPEPVTPENIRRIDEESYDAITAKLDELWRARSDDEAGNSGVNGAGSSRATAPHLMSSPG